MQLAKKPENPSGSHQAFERILVPTPPPCVSPPSRSSSASRGTAAQEHLDNDFDELHGNEEFAKDDRTPIPRFALFSAAENLGTDGLRHSDVDELDSDQDSEDEGKMPSSRLAHSSAPSHLKSDAEPDSDGEEDLMDDEDTPIRRSLPLLTRQLSVQDENVLENDADDDDTQAWLQSFISLFGG